MTAQLLSGEANTIVSTAVYRCDGHILKQPPSKSTYRKDFTGAHLFNRPEAKKFHHRIVRINVDPGGEALC